MLQSGRGAHKTGRIPAEGTSMHGVKTTSTFDTVPIPTGWSRVRVIQEKLGKSPLTSGVKHQYRISKRKPNGHKEDTH